MCGTKNGPIRITTEEHDAPPPLDLEAWTDVIEFSLIVIDRVVVHDWDDHSIHECNRGAPGPHRLRVHVRGRDDAATTSYRNVGEIEPVEEYLLQLWPASDDPEIVHKATDQIERRDRGEGAATPTEPLPRGRDRMSQAEFEEFERGRDLILGLTASMGTPARLLLIELIAEQLHKDLGLPDPLPQPPPEPPQPPSPPYVVERRDDVALAAMTPEMLALVDTDENLRLRTELGTKPRDQPQ